MAINPVIRTDAYVRHEIDTQRYAVSTSNKFIRDNMSVVEKEYADVLDEFGDITSRTEANKLASALSKRTTDVLESEVSALGVELESFAKVESGWNKTTLSIVIGNTVELAAPEVILRKSGQHVMTGGQTVNEFMGSVVKSNRVLAKKAVLAGWQEGKTNAQIAKGIIGSKKFQFKDGNIQAIRRNTTAAIRTQINAIGDTARLQTFKANSDIVKKEMILATLDHRTSQICQFYDRQVYKLGTGPRPPFHPNCRSLTIPLFDGETAEDIAGKRPAVNAGKGYERGDNTTRTGRVRKPRKGDDTFKVTRTNASQTSYSEFLRRQPVAFQEDVLGVGKARLFREGNLSVDDMVKTTKRGYYERPLTLAELEKKVAFSLADEPAKPVASAIGDVDKFDSVVAKLIKATKGNLEYKSDSFMTSAGRINLVFHKGRISRIDFAGKLDTLKTPSGQLKQLRSIVKSAKPAPKAPVATATLTTKKIPVKKTKADSFVNPTTNRKVAATQNAKFIEEGISKKFLDDLETQFRHVVASDDAKIKIRVPSKAVPGIIRDGRIKTSFESNAGFGSFESSPAIRREVEKSLFKYNKKVPDSARPIYGYLDDGSVKNSAVSAYGDVDIVLKKGVKTRSTITGDDSFGGGLEGNNFGVSAMLNPKRVSLDKRVVLDISDAGTDLNKLTAVDDFTSAYLEAQIHGGVKISDIDYLIFKSAPSESVKKILKENGINWTTKKDVFTPPSISKAAATTPKAKPSSKVTGTWTKQNLAKFVAFKKEAIANAKRLGGNSIDSITINGRDIKLVISNNRVTHQLGGKTIPSAKFRAAMKNYTGVSKPTPPPTPRPKPIPKAAPKLVKTAGVWTKQDLAKFVAFKKDAVAIAKTRGGDFTTSTIINGRNIDLVIKNNRVAHILNGKTIPAAKFRSALKAAEDLRTVPTTQTGIKTFSFVDTANVDDPFSVLAKLPDNAQAAKLRKFTERSDVKAVYVDTDTILAKNINKAKQQRLWSEHKIGKDTIIHEDNPNGFTHVKYNHVVMRLRDKKTDFSKVRPDSLSKGVDAAVRKSDQKFTHSGKRWSMSQAAMRYDVQYNFNPVSGTQPLVTFIHELGHQVHFWARADAKNVLDWKLPSGRYKSITEYGSKYWYEWHAEHFTAWVLNRAALARWDPEAAKYFDKLMDKALKSNEKSFVGVKVTVNPKG